MNERIDTPSFGLAGFGAPGTIGTTV